MDLNPGPWAAAKPLARDASGLWVAAGGPNSHTTGVSLGLLGGACTPQPSPACTPNPPAVPHSCFSGSRSRDEALQRGGPRAAPHTRTLTHMPHACKHTPQNSPRNPRHLRPTPPQMTRRHTRTAPSPNLTNPAPHCVTPPYTKSTSMREHAQCNECSKAAAKNLPSALGASKASLAGGPSTRHRQTMSVLGPSPRLNCAPVHV